MVRAPSVERPATAAPNTAYITGWDGLRALAVVAVIAFHFFPDTVPGGFLGVTTFLVLAGALATVRIGAEVERSGSFSGRDYARGRIRRLIPALLAYLVGVLVWTAVRSPEIYDSVGRDTSAAALYLTPWREMIGSANYETAFDTTPQPVLHTWSLGVEELAWILTGVVVAVSGRVRIAAIITTLVAVASYAVWWGESDLYYSPARLAEFAMGAGVGILLLKPGRLRVPSWLAIVAVGLLSWACLTWTVDSVYAGRLVLAAGLSAVLVVAAVGGPVGAVLSIAPLRWIGTRSYALYLWHVGISELSDVGFAPALGLTMVASELSYRLVESPIRRGRERGRRDRLVALLLVGTIAIAWFSASGPRPHVDTPDPSDLFDEALASAQTPVETDSSLVPSAKPSLIPDPTVPTPSSGPVAVPTTPMPNENTAAQDPPPPVVTRLPSRILLVGDSTALRLEPALREWGERNEADLDMAAFVGCTPAGQAWDLHLGLDGLDVIDANTECAPTDNQVLEAELVIVSYQGNMLLDHRLDGGEWVSLDTSLELVAQMRSAFGRIADLSTGPVVLLSVPRPLLDEYFVESVDEANSLLLSLAEERDDVDFVDASIIEAMPDRYQRSDGVHLDADGAAAFVVDVLVPLLAVPEPADS